MEGIEALKEAFFMACSSDSYRNDKSKPRVWKEQKYNQDAQIEDDDTP